MNSAPEEKNKFIRTYSKQMPSVINKTISNDDVICLDDEEIIILDEKESPSRTITLNSSSDFDKQNSSAGQSIESRNCGCLSSRNTSNLNVSSSSTLCILHDGTSHRRHHKIEQPSNLLNSVLSDIEKIPPPMTSLERVIKWQQINNKLNSSYSKIYTDEMPLTSFSADVEFNRQKRKIPFEENPGPNSKQPKLEVAKEVKILEQVESEESSNKDCSVVELIESNDESSTNIKLCWSDSSKQSDQFFPQRLKPREIDKKEENDNETYVKPNLSSILIRCNYTKNKEDEICFKKPLSPGKKVKLKVKFPSKDDILENVNGARCSGLIALNENQDNNDMIPNSEDAISNNGDDCSTSTITNVSVDTSNESEKHIFEKFSYLDSTYVNNLNSNPKQPEKFIYLDQHYTPESKSTTIKMKAKPLKKKKHPMKKRVYYMRYTCTTLRNGKVRSHFKGGHQKLQNIRLKLKPSFRDRAARNLKETPKEVHTSKIILKRISTDSALGQSVFNSPSSQNSEIHPIITGNHLKEEDGIVLSAYFESKFNVLIVVQEKLVSFWKYRTLLNFLGTGQIWDVIGVIERDSSNYDIMTQHQNRFTVCDDKICYMEVRGQNLETSDSRECCMTSLYLNLYFTSVTSGTIQMKSIQLDTLNVRPKDICFINLKNLNYIFIAWTESLPNFTVKSGICKYGLTPSLETLASIREFPHINHKINDLQQINPNKIIAIGDTEISVWNYNTGDLLVSTDLKITLGWNIKCFQHVENNENYIILIQIINSSYLKYIGIKLNDLYSWKILQSFHLPFEFNEKPNTTAHLSSLIVAKFNNNITILIPLNNLSNIFINNFYQDDSDNHEKSIFLHDDYIIKVNNSMLIKSVTEYFLEVKIV